MAKYLSDGEGRFVLRVLDDVYRGDANPDEVHQAIQILERERVRIIAENMRKVIDEENHEENYD